MPRELGLVRRGNRWIYRRRIPEDLRPLFGGRRELKQSLGTEVHAEAKILRNQVATRIDQLFVERRRQLKFSSLASAVHKYVAEQSQIDLAEIRKSFSDAEGFDDACDEARGNIGLYQDPDHELT